jgi:hypothetical protein
MGARVGDNMLFYIFTVFVLTYVVEELGLSESLALIGVSIAAFLEFFVSRSSAGSRTASAAGRCIWGALCSASCSRSPTSGS